MRVMSRAARTHAHTVLDHIATNGGLGHVGSMTSRVRVGPESGHNAGSEFRLRVLLYQDALSAKV